MQSRYLQYMSNVLYIRQRPDFSVADVSLPVGANGRAPFLTSHNVAQGDKEPTRMTNHRERVQEPTNSNERFGGWRKLAAIGALSTIALTGGASNVDAKPGPGETSVTAEPTETAEPTPTPVETGPSATEIEARIQELQMPAGLSDEELAEAYIDRYIQWLNAGV